MADYLTNLETARDQIAALIVEITAEKKPSYSVDGQSVSWESYLATLTNQLSTLNALIGQGAPFEHESTGDVNSW